MVDEKDGILGKMELDEIAGTVVPSPPPPLYKATPVSNVKVAL